MIESDVSPMTNPGQRRILLVEEDDVLGGVIRELLDRQGATVASVKSVDDALRYLSQAAVDVVIIDVDTVALLNSERALHLLNAWMRSTATAPSLVLVSLFVSSHGEKRDLFAASLGLSCPVHCVPKPFRNEQLLSAVSMAMDQIRFNQGT